MDYQNILNNIMYQLKDTDEVEKYIMDIKTNISATTLQGQAYLLFPAFANIYIKIREELEIHPKGCTIIFDDKKYEPSVVEANLKYALERISDDLVRYINSPIINNIN